MIKRTIKNEIIDHLSKKEITIIIGARQVGKTTLMQEILDGLQAKNEKVLALNLDIDSHAIYFVSQDTLLKKIELEVGDSGYVFIDEIQRIENAGLFLKGLYDRNLSYKYIISGSGSLELKEKIKESLAGRKRLFEMEPVTFTEFVNYKTNYKYDKRLSLFFELESNQTQEYLLEYLNFGGYPRIVSESTISEKTKLMNEIFNSYVEKDLVYLLKIERPDVFHLLIRILATQTGNIVNYSELAKHSGLAVPTLKRYLWYAEKTFCINYVSPYFTNALKEITKSPTYYFVDLGLRNFALGQMGNLSLPNQLGFVFQNYVFNLLKSKLLVSNATLHFWRTTDKAEVDFVVNKASGILPIEVKYGEISKPTISRSFRSFVDKYSPKEAWIINRNFESEIMINETKIRFLVYYALPQI
ncbi:MAG: ATP-binding protein [Salinivirgaceae bacterium]|jgi:predicted AAA+ superfamily ATPase|nr:ATP-binding protein [Salinivirgaceae bacterium]